MLCTSWHIGLLIVSIINRVLLCHGLLLRPIKNRGVNGLVFVRWISYGLLLICWSLLWLLAAVVGVVTYWIGGGLLIPLLRLRIFLNIKISLNEVQNSYLSCIRHLTTLLVIWRIVIASLLLLTLGLVVWVLLLSVIAITVRLLLIGTVIAVLPLLLWRLVIVPLLRLLV